MLEGRYEEAVAVARQQVENGAQLLDVNMDEGMLDSAAAMRRFLNLVAAEPDVARIPIVVDSSNWSVLEAGLKCLQGKGIVNSISLKGGEEEFKRQARLVRRYGAAVIVMAFDEKGQADTVDRKLEICTRAYRILTEEVGFPPQDVIFDPNVLTVATGMEEHNDYAVAFIEATRRIKATLPLAKVSGGISNISFSFRGNNVVREAMHSAFLYHAIAAGLDMGIVNAGQLAVYEEIPKDLLERVEDVLLNRRPDATERLVAFAESVKGQDKGPAKEDAAWRSGERRGAALPRPRQGRHGLHRGRHRGGAAEVRTSPRRHRGPAHGRHERGGRPLRLGEDVPAPGGEVRPRDEEGGGLAHSLPRGREAGERPLGRRARSCMATVKGDVHDIGKNIVGVVLACNNYEIVDLGVMVPAETILRRAEEIGADLIGLSGLITPSLAEMVHVAAEMERTGVKLPLLIGGATTSKAHTAVKIAPAYSQPVVHVLDASRAVAVVGQLKSPEHREAYAARNREEQEKLRREHLEKRSVKPLLPLAEARRRHPSFDWAAYEIPRPAFTGARRLENVAKEDIVPFIDWSPFFHTWELQGHLSADLREPRVGRAGPRALRRRAGGAAAHRGGRTPQGAGRRTASSPPTAWATTSRSTRTRRATASSRPSTSCGSRSDKGEVGAQPLPGRLRRPARAGPLDWLGAFAVTTGLGIEDLLAEAEADHDDYRAIMIKALADRLAEALAEKLHGRRARTGATAAGESLSVEELIRERYRGIRPAPGYPACPDHTEKRPLFDLIGAEAAGLRLTESFAMLPAASVSGFYFAHPQARYFQVGRIDRDQALDYHRRKGMDLRTVERWLAPNLDYEPEPLAGLGLLARARAFAPVSRAGGGARCAAAACRARTCSSSSRTSWEARTTVRSRTPTCIRCQSARRRSSGRTVSRYSRAVPTRARSSLLTAREAICIGSRSRTRESRVKTCSTTSSWEPVSPDFCLSRAGPSRFSSARAASNATSRPTFRSGLRSRMRERARPQRARTSKRSSSRPRSSAFDRPRSGSRDQDAGDAPAHDGLPLRVEQGVGELARGDLGHASQRLHDLTPARCPGQEGESGRGREGVGVTAHGQRAQDAGALARAKVRDGREQGIVRDAGCPAGARSRPLRSRTARPWPAYRRSAWCRPSPRRVRGVLLPNAGSARGRRRNRRAATRSRAGRGGPRARTTPSRIRAASPGTRLTTARATRPPATLPSLSKPTSMMAFVGRLRSVGTGVKSSS